MNRIEYAAMRGVEQAEAIMIRGLARSAGVEPEEMRTRMLQNTIPRRLARRSTSLAELERQRIRLAMAEQS